MNTFTPKSVFLKKRALDLHRSGEYNREIAEKLQVGRSTVDRWVRALKPKVSVISQAIDHAEMMNITRWAGSELPTLAYVPHIKLKKDSKYQMMRAP